MVVVGQSNTALRLVPSLRHGGAAGPLTNPARDTIRTLPSERVRQARLLRSGGGEELQEEEEEEEEEQSRLPE